MGEMILCLSRQDASTDTQYDLAGSFFRSGQLTCQIFKLTCRGQVAYVSMRLDERITMVFAFFSIFISSKVRYLLSAKRLSSKKEHFLFDMPSEGQNIT